MLLRYCLITGKALFNSISYDVQVRVYCKNRNIRITFFIAWCYVAVSSMAAPCLDVVDPLYRFGAVTELNSVEHVFVLKNTGDEDLSLVAKPENERQMYVTLAAQTLTPGSEIVLEAIMFPAGLTGYTVQRIALHTNDPDQPVSYVGFMGRVKPVYLMIPRALSFMRVRTNDTRTVMARLLPQTPLLGTRFSATADVSFLEATIDERSTPSNILLAVTTVPPLPPYKNEANITVVSDSPDDPKARIQVLVFVQPDFHVMPEQLVFEATRLKQQRIVFIRQHGKKHASILDIEPPNEHYICKVLPVHGTPHYDIYIYAHDLVDRLGRDGDIVISVSGMEQSVRIPIVVEP